MSSPAKVVEPTVDSLLVDSAAISATPSPMPPPPYSAIETERVGNHVLLTRMRGHVTRALAEGQFEQFRVLLAATPKPGWIIELGELTGFV